MTTTKTTFRAFSPFTGEAFKRVSAHAYVFAAITFETAESLAVKQLAEAAQSDESARECSEIASCLCAGTSPVAGSSLYLKAHSRSGNMERAGVRTRWDAVLFNVSNPLSVWRNDKIDFVARYEEYAKNSRADAAKHRANAVEILAKSAHREYATFHHSAALAQKAIDARAKYVGTFRHAVVEAR